MPLVARIVFGLCGAALALYAAASLTGNLAPPWWERHERDLSAEAAERANYEVLARTPVRGDFSAHPASMVDAYRVPVPGPLWHAVPCDGREVISIGVGAVGLTLAGFAVLGRRRAEAR